MNKSKQYVFFLGHAAELSRQEIVLLFEQKDIAYQELSLGREFFGVNLDLPLDIDQWQKRLGGTVKIGEVIMNLTNGTAQEQLTDFIIDLAKKNQDQKFKFALSAFGFSATKLFAWGLSIKKELKQLGITARLIGAKTPQLSAVAAVKEGLVKAKTDFSVINIRENWFLIKTLTIQDFEDYGKRDYGRPAIDSKSGMLPPKIAKILLNLLGLKTTDVFLDPFCGSGTILQEAILLGAKKVIGSDLSAKAVADSEKNLAWLKNNYQDINWPTVDLRVSSAEKLNNLLSPNSIDKIAFEGYLGPAFRLNQEKERALFRELDDLYCQTFKTLAILLKSGGMIAAAVPIIAKQPVFNAAWFKTLPLKQIKLSSNSHGSVIYSRPGQRVEREIFLWSKSE